MEQQKAKLYLNMILAEDEPVEVVKRAIDSVKESVDGMYITITYKNEQPTESELISLLQTYGANISFFKWVYDFSAARNYAMAQAPRGEDCYILWIDADDVVQNAEKLHTVADEALAYHHAAVYFQYFYMVDLDEDGSIREILINQKRERIIRNDGTFKWVSMLHETLIAQAEENVIMVPRNDCVVVHLTDQSRLDKNMTRNIEILEKQAREEKHSDPRTIIYLAKAYYDKAKFTEAPNNKIYYDLALTLFHEYLEGWGIPGTPGYNGGSGWAEERATAYSYVGEIAMLSQNYPIAIQAFQSAIDEAPQFPIYYVNLATCYSYMDDYKRAKIWLTHATNMDDPDTTIITTPRDLKLRALEVSYQINLHEGRLEYAKVDAEEMCKIMPDNQMLKDRYLRTISLEASNKAAQSIVYLGKYLEQIKEEDKIPELLKAIPNDLQHEKFAAEMRHIFNPPKNWADNEIALLCGPGFEEWTPNSIKTGLGGSEEAVVYLSQELAKRGWRVTVYANPGAHASGMYDGVEYKQWWDVNPKDQFNVLILWRAVGFVDIEPKAKFTLLWLHDVPNNPDFTEKRLEKIDKIAVLSEYHKSLLRVQKEDGTFGTIPDEKIFLTSNGVPDLYPGKWSGNPHRLIYCSSPDRGLPYLLLHWPTIKEAVPDAELHVFYGFNVYDAIHRDNPERKKYKEQLIAMMNQPGITYHGRVGHLQLRNEIARSGIWAYPTDFQEISCITAMKAQVLGAIPVVTDYAALQETVKNGVRCDVNIRTEEGQAAYFQTLVNCLQDVEGQKTIRGEMMKFAKDYFGWDKVAANWDELLRRKIQNPEIPVIEGGVEDAIR